MSRPRRIPAFLAALGPRLGLALALGGSGCVHVYQPMSGLHRPVVIDTGIANFQDVALDIYCLPGRGLALGEAASLCRKVAQLFENQGAQVSTALHERRLVDPTDAVVDGGESPPRATSLVLELRAHDLDVSKDPLSWLLCFGTFTLVPGVTEITFAQDVVIRDASGFLLSSETQRGRIVRRFGLGAWGGNTLLDLIWRDKRDQITGYPADRALSADLYQQLSQLVFNAKMRTMVLQEGPPVSETSP